MTTKDAHHISSPTEADYRAALDHLSGRSSAPEPGNPCTVCGITLADCLRLLGCCEVCGFLEADAHGVIAR